MDWYRQAFGSAVHHGVIDEGWYRSREAWHAHAHRTFPSEPIDYYDHIYAAEKALTSEAERRRLTAESEIRGWYRGVFDHAAKLGIAPTYEVDSG